MLPTDEEIKKVEQAIRTVVETSSERPDRLKALSVIGEFIQTSNNNCCGCGWAIRLAEFMLDMGA